MLFNSVTYLFIFLPTVAFLHWALPERLRLWIILLSSLAFYGFWRIEFVPLLLFSATLDYVLALWIEGTENPARRRRIMLISVAVNLAILGFFKYLLFFRDTLWSISGWLGYQPTFVDLYVVLPLGISFYIFATISYVIDVYRREFKAERNFIVYCNFVVFFPHLVAGPILRARNLIPQLRGPAQVTWSEVNLGISRILQGLFLKVVLADTIAGYVDSGFARDASTLTAFDVWALAFLFGFQIYFDFAGYSHIAIGSARLFGIVLPENFNFPYLATSPRDFWQRWHISLSSWIRDYVYMPMVGHAAYSPAGLPSKVEAEKTTQHATRKPTNIFTIWHLGSNGFVARRQLDVCCVGYIPRSSGPWLSAGHIKIVLERRSCRGLGLTCHHTWPDNGRMDTISMSIAGGGSGNVGKTSDAGRIGHSGLLLTATFLRLPCLFVWWPVGLSGGLLYRGSTNKSRTPVVGALVVPAQVLSYCMLIMS